MSTLRQLLLPGLPAPVTVHTKNDKLYNDFLELLKEENASFLGIEVNSSGKNFVKTVVECLWYVDGHHEKFKKQSDTCDIFKPVKLPKEVFDSLHVLPDLVPSEDGHYKTLEELLGTETDGSHRPSLQKTSKRKKTLPFSASVQHVKNVDLMLQCDGCFMWRLLYSRFKLTRKERPDLQVAIDDISFTCGAPLQDLQLPGHLSEVYTRELSCGESIEKLYYTAKYTLICIYCADDVESVPKDKYPQCHACKDKPEIMKT